MILSAGVTSFLAADRATRAGRLSLRKTEAGYGAGAALFSRKSPPALRAACCSSAAGLALWFAGEAAGGGMLFGPGTPPFRTNALRFFRPADGFLYRRPNRGDKCLMTDFPVHGKGYSRTNFPLPCLIQLLSPHGSGAVRRTSGTFQSFSHRRLVLTAPHSFPVSRAVSLQHEDVLMMGEVLACEPTPEGTWQVLVQVQQLLNGLQNLLQLRDQLLGTPPSRSCSSPRRSSLEHPIESLPPVLTGVF